MYSEKKFKNYIFWIQVKRVVLIILFSVVGAGIGIAIGAILRGTVNVTTYNNLIIIVLTILFFLLSLLVTSGTGKEVQDGYWKIAVLRKLTAIQKTIELSNELMQKSENIENHFMKKMSDQNKEIEKIIVENVDNISKADNAEKIEDIKKAEVSEENEKEKITLKKKKNKTLKKPELIN